jgi:hypothetical protein
MKQKKNGVTEAQQDTLDLLEGLGQRTIKVREHAERLASKSAMQRRFTEDVRRAEEMVERRA